MTCNHNWSAEPHEGLGSHYCHICNEWEIEVNYDRALAEVERLLNERRQLRARLVECRPWVGVCPFPNQPGFSEMLAIRDLADDTLNEVKP